MKYKRLTILVLCTLFSYMASAKRSELFVVKQGDPLVLLQENKTAIFEIDYSKLVVTDSKNHDNDLDFFSWMKAQDSDDNEWLEDWQKKDKADCDMAFRDEWNNEIKNGIELTKLGKHYKVIFRPTMIDFGPAVKYGFRGVTGGEAMVDGQLEVRDINTNEVQLILEINQLKGESSFKQIGRLKGIFENLGEELNDYLKDYKKKNR